MHSVEIDLLAPSSSKFNPKRHRKDINFRCLFDVFSESFGLNFEDEGGIWCSKFSNCCNFVSRLEIFEKFRNWHSGLLLKYIASFWFLIFLKFIYRGKASKFEKIFHLFLALLSNVKTKGKMFSNFCSPLRILKL